MALTQRKKPQFKNLKIILCYIVFGILYLVKMGFPSGARSKETSCQCKRLEKWVRSIPGSGRSPAGGTATHSSILAWRIPWTEEPGGLQSMGLPRVRHN